MLQKILLWLEKADQNKVSAALVLLVSGVLLRDLLTYLFQRFLQLLRWIGKKLGGRLGYRYLEKAYLNWLVTELRELKLAGIVGADAAKKPKLEQVFVSLRVGEQEGRFSAVEAALAVADEIRKKRGKISSSVIRGLERTDFYICSTGLAERPTWSPQRSISWKDSSVLTMVISARRPNMRLSCCTKRYGTSPESRYWALPVQARLLSYNT